MRFVLLLCIFVTARSSFLEHTNLDSGCTSCSECQGPCTSDDHCAGNLKCFDAQTSDLVGAQFSAGITGAPGCGQNNFDNTKGYCYNPDGCNGVANNEGTSSKKWQLGCDNMFTSLALPTTSVSFTIAKIVDGTCESNQLYDITNTRDCLETLGYSPDNELGSTNAYTNRKGCMDVGGDISIGTGSQTPYDCTGKTNCEIYCYKCNTWSFGCHGTIKGTLSSKRPRLQSQSPSCGITEGSLDIWVNGALQTNELFDVLLSDFTVGTGRKLTVEGSLKFMLDNQETDLSSKIKELEDKIASLE